MTLAWRPLWQPRSRRAWRPPDWASCKRRRTKKRRQRRHPGLAPRRSREAPDHRPGMLRRCPSRPRTSRPRLRSHREKAPLLRALYPVPPAGHRVLPPPHLLSRRATPAPDPPSPASCRTGCPRAGPRSLPPRCSSPRSARRSGSSIRSSKGSRMRSDRSSRLLSRKRRMSVGTSFEGETDLPARPRKRLRGGLRRRQERRPEQARARSGYRCRVRRPGRDLRACLRCPLLVEGGHLAPARRCDQRWPVHGRHALAQYPFL